jgi:hypothetical protein
MTKYRFITIGYAPNTVAGAGNDSSYFLKPFYRLKAYNAEHAMMRAFAAPC